MLSYPVVADKYRCVNVEVLRVKIKIHEEILVSGGERFLLFSLFVMYKMSFRAGPANSVNACMYLLKIYHYYFSLLANPLPAQIVVYMSHNEQLVLIVGV